MQGVSAGKGALFDLFDRIESFFRRLEVYIGLPSTVEMTDTIVMVMAEVLRILALVTKEIKRGMISELILDDRTSPRLVIFQRNSLENSWEIRISRMHSGGLRT